MGNARLEECQLLSDTESPANPPPRQGGKNESERGEERKRMVSAKTAAAFQAILQEGIGRLWLVEKLHDDPDNPPLLNNEKYLAIGELGSGGMGKVYLARQGNPKRDVAIKVVPQAVNQEMDDANRIRIRRETDIGGRLQHQGFVQVYEGWDPDPQSPDSKYGKHFIVMELVPHLTLQAYIKEHGHLDLPLVLAIGKSAAQNLLILYKNDIVHRDLKPSNIFLVLDDNDPWVKICDFGLARFTSRELREEEAHHENTLTNSAMVVGTPCYSSPEQVLSPHLPAAWHIRNDIYSLGITLAECLRGEHPFRDSSPFDIYDFHKNGKSISDHYHPFVKPGTEERQPDLGQAETALEKLYTCMVHPDPEKRIPPKDLVGEFERIADILRAEQAAASQGRQKTRFRLSQLLWRS